MPITINGSGTITGVNVGGLPDGIVDTDMIANSAVTSAKSSGLGISMAETWSLSSNLDHAASPSGTIDPVTANWVKQQAGSSLIGNIGSSMTESSGVFTFPSIGYYLILVDFYGKCTSSTDSEYHGIESQLSSDSGSNYTVIAQSAMGASFSQQAVQVSNHAIADVTNASNFRWRVRVMDDQDATWYGVSSGTAKACGGTFIKIGDT